MTDIERAKDIVDRCGRVPHPARVEAAILEALSAVRREQIEVDAMIAETDDAWPSEGADIAAAIRAQEKG